ncbi:kynureninase [Autumnicola musiva]|uniref:Kynureninase n=1 Tax=Autumnicola musiva TaxID=3075589 RepID=A0ABU3D2K5_9FLAO|nr:kynureninase [Zunongwangia sp. F117]MDT0675766.1 kynureninase [Zunongwangia sp. F117]
MKFENSLEFARKLDSEDKIAKYRNEFIFPKVDGKEVIYFVGNSLGLQPKTARDYVDEIMQDWANLGVEGHFYSEKPWWDYHERFAEKLAKIVGANPSEVTVMNTLTVNLHLLMISFYRPSGKRFKIICEEKAFPSDQYMIASQVRVHGFDPSEAIIEIKKRDGENIFRTGDVLKKISEVGEECALVLIGGVNYYSGQVFDMEKITSAGHEVGAMVGWDLAHAAGNVELKLSEWNVDFAAWCSYKYMNSGPGNASGCFINRKYHNKKDLPRLEGWWGHNKERRFLMEPEFLPEPNANAWQISNAPVLALAPYLASLEMFDEVGMPALIEKRNKIVTYLEFILQDIDKQIDSTFEVITPSKQEERGTQLSVFLHGKGREVFNYLMKNGVYIDWREPNVIRLAPAPFYCSYEDIYNFGQIMKKAILNS